MRMLRRFLRQLFSWMSTSQNEVRLRAEIEEHLALQTAENIRAGQSPMEARRQAVLKFGAIEKIRGDIEINARCHSSRLWFKMRAMPSGA